MIKNKFSHARQPHEESFEIGSCCGPLIMAISSNFDQPFPNNGTVHQKHLAQNITDEDYKWLDPL